MLQPAPHKNSAFFNRHYNLANTFSTENVHTMTDKAFKYIING